MIFIISCEVLHNNVAPKILSVLASTTTFKNPSDFPSIFPFGIAIASIFPTFISNPFSIASFSLNPTLDKGVLKKVVYGTTFLSFKLLFPFP